MSVAALIGCGSAAGKIGVTIGTGGDSDGAGGAGGSQTAGGAGSNGVAAGSGSGGSSTGGKAGGRGGSGAGGQSSGQGGTSSMGGAGGQLVGGGGTMAGSGGRSGAGGGVKIPPGGAAGMPPDPCVMDGQCPAGKWIGVTPASVDLTSDGTCGNFGTKTIQADSSHPGELYTMFFCQGVWKSTDYGQTWKGPINTGKNGSTVTDCAGGVTVAPVNGSTPPIIYVSCIRGAAIGFWSSTNGGVDWTTYNVAPAMPGASGQQFYPPVVDPYDSNHVLMVAHTFNLLLESTNGGKDFVAVHTEAGMKMPDGATGGIDFINTGDATTTRSTWLWLAVEGSNVGTWRTTNSGQNWTKVETNEHITGATSIAQSGKGDMYMTGTEGILRSVDFGQHWTKTANGDRESVVVATSRFLYAQYGWAIGAGQAIDVDLQVAPVPGTGTWTKPGAPANMIQGAASGITINDGKNNIVVVANYNAGLWRYIEPAN
jgi:hypothetical protein